MQKELDLGKEEGIDFKWKIAYTFFFSLFFLLQFLCPISVQKALEIATPSFKGCLLSYWTAVQTADFRLSDV